MEVWGGKTQFNQLGQGNGRNEPAETLEMDLCKDRYGEEMWKCGGAGSLSVGNAKPLDGPWAPESCSATPN